MDSSCADLPLFPLSTVLFPGGRLQLRVFEPRYVDLVRECTRAQRPFGVNLIMQGHEAGVPATPVAVGTLAFIRDFFTLRDGLLGILAEGGQRYRVLRTRVRGDGQLRADVALWPQEPAQPLPPEFGLLVAILDRLLEAYARDAPVLYDAAQLDDAVWVGWRLAELLPLTPDERQSLLETDDALARLTALNVLLPRFQRD
ncbi:LON peptidase substrate-binding domain-containing protein [Metallibacterium sp.]|uniref:LON peptidase substrate-binding domain-containing protein n=1 Tax=Metallibacterium sp. TaxID=2940281 RepID=UPI00260A1719|nr:LON peptidase substrate-binding domain-containing protein [Metallibacterium sp.]